MKNPEPKRLETTLLTNHIASFGALFVTVELEFNEFTFLQGFEALGSNFGEMDENIVAKRRIDDESEAFFLVEPFYCSLWHNLIIRSVGLMLGDGRPEAARSRIRDTTRVSRNRLLRNFRG
jgi:hypothetical protein